MTSPKKKSLAIYGGSFSPPHTGHVLACRAYLDRVGADRAMIIPAKKPPHKSLDNKVSDADRVEMCKLAFCEDEQLSLRCEVSEWELMREDVSYTVNTVEHFISEGYEDIYLLIGTDMLLSFESWYRFRDIMAMATLCYIDRENELTEKTRECAQRFCAEYGARIIALDAPVFEASSTEIRDRIARGDNVDTLLPEKVKEYIIKNSLYK